MFNQSKYTLWYNNLISKAQERGRVDGYKENHHIIPSCLGGSNDPENRVDLTAREHFVAHLLLTKMFDDEDSLYRMRCAALRVSYNPAGNEEVYHKSSHVYEQLRKQHAKDSSQRMKGNTHKLGKKESESTKLKKRIAMGKSITIGRWIRTEESVAKMRMRRKGKGCGGRNAMADPVNREKVAASKRGRKLYVNKLGNRRLFHPGTEPAEFTRA